MILESDRHSLELLAEAAEVAKRNFEALQLGNEAKDIEAQIKQRVEYELGYAEHRCAVAALANFHEQLVSRYK